MDINDIEKWHFALTEETCNYLLKLVLEGKKKATTSSLWGYEIEGGKIPETGTGSIITDWNGISKCLVKTTKLELCLIRILPLKLQFWRVKMTALNHGVKIMRSFSKKKEDY